MISIAVCDDEATAVQALESKIKNYMISKDIPCKTRNFLSGKALLESIAKQGNAFDAVFLDIKMNEINGIDTAKAIRKTDAKIIIVFVTALKEYVFDAFDVSAMNFLVKPIEEEKLFAALNKIAGAVNSAQNKALVIHKSGALTIIFGILPMAISLVVFKFFIYRYSIKSAYKARYLLAFSLPIFFISVALRTINYTKYFPASSGFIIKANGLQNYEVSILIIMAFLCICAVLFAYEKTIKQIDNENASIMLETVISAQKNYVTEAKEKYEATKAFRHDFKNHIIVLRGLIERSEVEKASAYMERFEAIDKEISFLVASGNTVLDILLSEKLSYAQKMGIDVQCDVLIPNTVKLDDFDLCAIFANAIDNAIKACGGLEDQEKSINIVARQNNSFFIIDIINGYKSGSVPSGSGIGLSTIQIIADKYHGATEVSDADGIFRISVILPF